MSKKKKVTLATVAGIVVLGGLLVACNGGGSSSPTGAGGGTTPPPVTEEPTGDTPPPTTYVPYDPNGEGVRPDVRQYIEETQPDSTRTRAALFQYAKVLEASIRDADSKELSLQHTYQTSRAVECAGYTLGSARVAYKLIKEVHATILNTDERNRAYFKYLEQIGSPYVPGTPDSEMSSTCDIDPATLPN